MASIPKVAVLVGSLRQESYNRRMALAQPEAYLGGGATLFDTEGRIANESTRGLMQKFLDAFAAWVAVQRKPA